MRRRGKTMSTPSAFFCASMRSAKSVRYSQRSSASSSACRVASRFASARSASQSRWRFARSADPAPPVRPEAAPSARRSSRSRAAPCSSCAVRAPGCALARRPAPAASPPAPRPPAQAAIQIIAERTDILRQPAARLKRRTAAPPRGQGSIGHATPPRPRP